MKAALLFAQAVSVLCPHCQEAIPSPDNGSELWTIEDIAKVKGKKIECFTCGQTVLISAAKKARLQ